jgi:hypothetical protein
MSRTRHRMVLRFKRNDSTFTVVSCECGKMEPAEVKTGTRAPEIMALYRPHKESPDGDQGLQGLPG